MATAEVLSRIVLAVVFATAGVGKLRDLSGSRQAMRDFGVPASLADATGLLLPLAELAVAIALVLRPTALGGAIAALVLLLVFITGIANALRHGVAPDCHCFGQIHSAPAGRGTLIRNGVLVAIAVFIVAAGSGPAFDAWASARSAAELVAVCTGLAAAGLAILSAVLWRELRGMSEELNVARRMVMTVPPGLPVGAQAPSFDLLSLAGERVTLENLLDRGRPLLLMFASPGCSSCHDLFPDIRRWQRTLSERLTIAIISAGGLADNQPLAEEFGLQDILIPEQNEMIEAYRIRGTPSVVLVNLDGLIGSTPAEGATHIEPTVRLALRNAPASGVLEGAAA